MWPFRVKQDFHEDRPPAPCWNQKEHYYWVDAGWKCPLCASMKMKQEKTEDEDRMAEKIAAAVVRQLRARSK